MSTENKEVYVFCDYDPTISGNTQDILQITLTEEAEGMYRLGDITIGENRSDSGYWLYQNGYSEVRQEDTEENDGSYRSTYVNKDKIPVYIITYDQFSYVTNVIAIEINDYFIGLYDGSQSR